MKTQLTIASSQSLSLQEWQVPAIYRNDRCIIPPIALQLVRGHWTVLLGDSGIGKTTLLRCLAGLSEPMTCSPELAKVAYMAQHDGLLPWKTIIKNVYLGDLLRKQSPDRERALRLLKQVSLAKYATALPETLSVGMRQRVALARTLYEQANLVLLDEPFSSLDTGHKQQLYALSKSLLAGKTVLHVTHDPIEALQLADTILIMHDQPAIITEYCRHQEPQPLQTLSEVYKSKHYQSLMEKITWSKA